LPPTIAESDPKTLRRLVIYESMFGNTKSIAEAVALGLAGDVELLPVEAAPTELGLDVGLVVLGGPTHGFTLSSQATRHNAVRIIGHPVTAEDIGLREWLSELQAYPTTAFATFDTRTAQSRLPGSAARAASRRLQRTGLPVIVPPTSFYVASRIGPLQDGERTRACRWGLHIASLLRFALENAHRLPADA
jgi:hypothetical protein